MDYTWTYATLIMQTNVDANQGARVAPPSPEGEPTSSGALVSALAWTSGAKWGAQALSWTTTIVVARILTPHDYGLVGMGMLILGVATLIAEMGVGTAVVTQGIRDPTILRQLNGLALFIGVSGFLLVAGAAPYVAHFFGSPELVPVMSVLAATVAVQSAGSVPGAVLAQERKFRLLAQIEAGRAVVGALATVCFALIGWGYWALVVGSVASAFCASAASVAVRPVAWAVPRRRVIGPAVQVSLDVVGARLAWYLYSSADFLVAGRVLGSIALGTYTMAWTIATAPVDKIAATLNGVSQSFFAANRAHPQAVRAQFLRLTEGIALITVPACVGLALVADDLIAALLGDKWAGAALPLKLLCLYTPLRCIAVVVSPLLLALQESRYLLGCTVATAVALPFFFVIGSQWGPPGIAATWAVAYPLAAIPLYARALPRVGVTPLDFLRALRTPMRAGAGMALVVLIFQQMLPHEWSAGPRVGTQIVVAMAAWGASLLVFDRSTVSWLLRLARQSMGSGTSGSS